jgi:hypothetical protein
MAKRLATISPRRYYLHVLSQCSYPLKVINPVTDLLSMLSIFSQHQYDCLVEYRPIYQISLPRTLFIRRESRDWEE